MYTVIGVSGIPGSGKTTFSKIIVNRINDIAKQASPDSPAPATFLPMDGFHLTRAQLSAMPDPDHAHARRGAHFTFDASKFLSLVQSLRLPLGDPIYAPSFDHAVKDPKDNDIVILPTQRIVIIEGNYVALDKEIWREAAVLLDERWFFEVDFEVARQRLRERHVRAGIVQTIEEGDKRAMENDLVNGREIVDHLLNINEVVKSTADESWAAI